MGRLPEREVVPSREAMGDRKGPSFGRKLNVSVPISFGLPLIVVGLFTVFTGWHTGGIVLWIFGGAMTLAGVLLFASGKRL